MAKVEPPVAPKPSPTLPPLPRPAATAPGLKPVTPAAKGLSAPAPTAPPDPRGAEPRLQDFEDDFAYGIAYGMWKKGAPYEQWAKYRKGGEKSKPADLGIITKLPSTARSLPGETLKMLPSAAVGLGQFAAGFVQPSRLTEGEPGLVRAAKTLMGINKAVDMTVDSLKATPQTLQSAVDKLEEGKFPAPEVFEVTGNVALATGVGAAAARGRLSGLQTKAGASAKAARKAERLKPVVDQLNDISRVANKIADAPITLPAKATGRTWQYWVDSRRNKATDLRAKANFEESNVGGETVASKRFRQRADNLEARYGKVIVDENGDPILDETGKPVISTNTMVRRMMNRVQQTVNRNQASLVRDLRDLKEGQEFGPITDVEEQAMFAVANGRAQLIAEIARRTGESPGDIAFKSRPLKSEEGRYLSREGAELAVALINGTLDPATAQRLTAATTRLKEIMEINSRVKRKRSSYMPDKGYGRRKPLDPAMDVPTPKPEWLIEALENEGSGRALALAEEIREQFQDPETGEFVYDPQAPETILFIMDIMQDAPEAVVFNPQVYPGKERNNIVAYLNYLRANEALAGMTVRGAPPGPDTTPRAVRPLSETPETGLPPEEIYGDALEPGTLSRMPRKFIGDAIKQLERLRGRARRIAEQITDIQLKIETYERKIIKLSLELDALNGWYEDGNGRVVRFPEGAEAPAGLEYRPGLIQRARTKVLALRAAVQKMNDEQADTTTVGDVTVTRAEAESKLAVAETQLADLETSAVNLENQIDALDDGVDRLNEESTTLENEMIAEGVDPDPLLDALDKDIAGMPRDPLNAETLRTVAIPASVIAEAPWIQNEYQGTQVQRNGVAFYEYDFTPDDLIRIQRQLEGQVSYYSQKPQTGDTPQRLKNLRAGLKTVDANLPQVATYQPTNLFQTIAPENAIQKQIELDAEHRAAYQTLSELVDEADQLAEIANAEEVIYRIADDIYSPSEITDINELVPVRSVQDAVRNEWGDAYDFLDIAVGLGADGRPASRIMIGIVESAKRRDARGRVVSDKFGRPIPGLFDAAAQLGSMERLRRRKSPYVGYGQHVQDPGASAAIGASRGTRFVAIDQAMAAINESGRFGQFDDPITFMEKFVEMADVFDSLNGFISTGRLPRRVYSNKVRDFPLQIDETTSMTFDDYMQARRDPDALAAVLRAEADSQFNQVYSDLADPNRRARFFPQLGDMDTAVVLDIADRAGNRQPPTAISRLAELEPRIVDAQQRIDDIGGQLAAVEEAIALQPAATESPNGAVTTPETEAALARAAETGQLVPVGRFAEGGPSALREVDWVKETASQYSINTGTRNFRINKVGKVWVLKRIASDGKVLDASAQEFSSFPAARRYVQEGIEFDKSLPTRRPVFRPGFELGLGNQAIRDLGPQSELVRAEREMAQRQRKALRTVEQIQARTKRVDELRVEEARLRAILPAITEAAVRLEARLGQEVVTQPDVTVAGRLGQPTGRVLIGQESGAPAVAQPVSPDGVPLQPGSPVGGLLRPEVQVVRGARQAAADAGNIEYEVTLSERSANRALLARTQNLPPTLPLEVSYAIGQMEGTEYIGSTYFPATYKPSAAPGSRRGFEPGLVGDIVVDTEKLKTGEGMDIWSIQELVQALARDQRAMDLNEGFRMLISSKLAVTPRAILGEQAIETIIREAERLALLDPDLNPQYPSAVAAYPLGNPNREAVFELARNKIIGEMIQKKMRDLGYETLPTTGNIDGKVNFEDINGDRPFLPAYTREKVRARYPDFDARPIPLGVDRYLRAVTATTTAFKQVTLPLSIRWQLGDLIGMYISAAVAGVSPAQFTASIAQAARDNYGSLREVFADPNNKRFLKYDRRISPRGRLQGQSGLQEIGLRAEETAFLQGQQIGTEQRGIIASTPILGRMVETYQQTVVKGAYKINQAINTIGRHAFANIQFERVLNERGLTLDSIPEGGAEALDPAVREALYDAADVANEFMGDYMDMSPMEKKWVLPHITFYAWVKHVHKLFLKLAKDHPSSIRWHLYLGAMAFEEDADPTGIASGSWLWPGYGFVDLNWASPLSDIALGPVGSLVSAASAGKPVYPENPLRPALGSISPLPRIIGAGLGLNVAQVRGIQRPTGTGMVTSTGAPTPTPLLLRPNELLGFAVQQFPIGTRLLDILPQGEIPGLGLATGPVRRFDTGQARLKYKTNRPEVKGTGVFGWRGAATRLLTLPFLPEMSQEEKERFERTARVRLRQFEKEKRRAEARND